MVGFAGWEMPVQYSGILEEHRAVRSSAGLFDISHMGQLVVEGSGAAAWLDALLTNRASALAPGEGHYTLMLNGRGGVIDDMLVYRLEEGRFFLVINASKTDEDLAWMRARPHPEVEIHHRTGFAALALQGPRSGEILAACCRGHFPAPGRNCIALAEGGTLVARTGYTGEDGFEIFLPATAGTEAFERLLAVGEGMGIRPCGLGARDTLRLEMGYPLNGNDLSPERTPLEAGLGFFVDLEKAVFEGKAALLAQKEAGLPSKLAAIRMVGPGAPPRPHYPVLHHGERVGELCSGTLSPSLGCGIAMAYLPPEIAAPGTALEIAVRDRHFPAETVKKPFYRKEAGFLASA